MPWTKTGKVTNQANVVLGQMKPCALIGKYKPPLFGRKALQKSFHAQRLSPGNGNHHEEMETGFSSQSCARKGPQCGSQHPHQAGHKHL